MRDPLSPDHRSRPVPRVRSHHTTMPIYHTLGSIPRKRHTAFRKPNGGIYAEELMGHEGFTGTSSLLYHVHPPTTVKSVRRVKETAFEADPDQTLRHRHFLTAHAKKGGSPTLDRIPLLFNQDIAMLYVEPDKQDEHFYRNAQADELVYVAKGKGTLESVFGDLPFGEGDYLVIHRGILHRYKFDAERPSSRSCSSSRAAGTSAGPSDIATSSASSRKARRTPSATSAVRWSSRRTTRWATSGCS